MVKFKIVDINRAKDEDAAEVVITPEFVLDALDVWAPKGGLGLGSQTLGRYEVISAPADDANGGAMNGLAAPL